MSDSSLGDSLFSYQSNRRFFGSTESCRFGFECRRCSLDGDKCSYSDNCRHGDRCRNCDCSSSYFSSDFDDTQNFSRRSSSTRYSHKSNNTNTQTLQQQLYHDNNKYYEQKTTRYAEDFIKHVNNVKYNNNLGDDNLQQHQQQQRKIQHVYETIGEKKRSGAGQMRGIGSTSTVEYSSSSDTAMLGSANRKLRNSSRNKSSTEEEYKSLTMTNEKYATINNATSTKKSSNEAINTTMKRRRNKTTGTIPKLNTFDSSSNIQQQRINMRHETNRSEINLSRTNDLYSSSSTMKLKRYQSDDIDRGDTGGTSNDGGAKFQTIEQLEHNNNSTTTIDNSIITVVKQKQQQREGESGDKAKGDENSIIYDKSDNDKNVKQQEDVDDEVFVNNLTYEMTTTPKQRRVS